MSMNKFFLFIFIYPIIYSIFSITLKLNAETLLIGDSKDNNSTFTFNVKSHGIYIPAQRFFIASDQEIDKNNYSISLNSPNLHGNNFIPMAPERVIYNNIENVDNPLYGAAIEHMCMAGYFPIVTKKDEPSIYAINDLISSTINVFSVNNIADSNGLPAKKIVGIMSDLPFLLDAPESLYTNRYIFMAVTNNQDNFDGIALAQLQVKKEIKDNKERTFYDFVSLDAQDGILGNRASRLSNDSKYIKINCDVQKIENVVDMHYDNILNRLYIALQVKTSKEQDSGAKAIVVAALSGNKIIFQNIAPDNMFKNESKIVGAQGSNLEINIHKVRTMFTRTYLNYLIVCGGTGENTKQKVFALPLINNVGSEYHGCLASINHDPVDVYTKGLPHRFLIRTFLQEPENEMDLYSECDLRAKVGGQEILPGDITDIQVCADTVFVSVEEDGNNQKSGIFYSQALFDKSGKIVSWTKWARASLNITHSTGFCFNPIMANFWSISNKDNEKNKVYYTSWTKGSTEFEKLISREFLSEFGGVLNVTSYNYANNKSLNNNIGNRLSFLVLTGHNKVGLVQSSKDIDNIFTPVLLDKNKNIFKSEDGTLLNLDVKNNHSILFISGGDLKKVYNINSSAIIYNKENSWLVVGGSNGLAILTNKNGAGWKTSPGLSKDFNNLTNDLYFKYIANYNSIKKLIGIENRLYILTDDRLDRIDFDEESIALNNFKIKNLARSFGKNLEQVEILTDILICEPAAFLGTSNGFFVSDLSYDISKIDYNPSWKRIIMPEAAGNLFENGPVTKFFPISIYGSGSSLDLIKNGNIYLLNSYSGSEQGQLYRYCINTDLNNLNIENKDSYINIFPDIFIQDKPTFFVNLEDYRTHISTDGAIIAVCKNSFIDEPPRVYLLPYDLKSGRRFGARSLISLDLNIEEFKTIGPLQKIDSGAWIINGDFGLRLNI